MQNMPTRAEIKEKFSGASGITLAAWILSSLIAIILPVAKWTRERNQYYSYMGKYHEYEWKQRQYEEMQNGNGMYNTMNMCSWWNFRCRKRVAQYQYYMQRQQGGENRQGYNVMGMLPGWYTFFGGSVNTEGEGREAEMGMNSQSSGAMKFVYFWNIIMFLGVSIFGYRTLANGKDRMGLIVALLIYAQFSLMNLITITQGAIQTDERFFENSIYGWFGQWSVLVAYTDFWMFLHSIIFAAVLGLIQYCNRDQTEDVKDVSGSEDEYVQEGAYVQPDVSNQDADYVHA